MTHKIRIPYIPIKNTCLILCKNLITFIQSLEGTNNKLIQGFIKLLKNLKWDISIKQNSDFKTSLLNKNLNNKEIHLTKALPKYLWCATALIEDIAIFDLIFDATDIEQGNVFIDYLSYSDTEYGENIYAILKKYSKLKIEETSNHIDILDEMEDNYLNGILHYCNKEQTYKDSLDEIFGYLKIPKLIKSEEIKDNVINDSKIFRENFQSSSNFNLEDNSEYI